MQVKLSKQAEKYYLSQDRVSRQRIKKGLMGLEEVPPIGDIVSIAGTSNTYRLRIGNFRVLFEVENDIIIVTKLHSRGQIYKY